jgi:hypothetical protein
MVRHGAAQVGPRFARRTRCGAVGTQSAQLARMARRVAFALGLVSAVWLLLRSATGCSSAASDQVGDAGAGDGGFVPLECNAGCLCFAVDECPAGCYPSQITQPDGAASETFCSNGIVTCVPGGGAWSAGAPTSGCPGGTATYPVTYVDGGPGGSFCCASEPGDEDAGTDAAGDAAGDTGIDPASAACAAAGGQCGYGGANGCTIVGPEQACNSDQPGGSFCCAVTADAGCTDGGITASSYDQSCTIDSDCIAVAEGDSCSLCGFNCPNAAINVGQYGKYLADIAYTPADISGQRQACSDVCRVTNAPCCVGGACQACPVVVVHPGEAGAQ